MSGWKLLSEFKTIGRGPDVTPICSNATENITLIVCKIRTNRTGAECRLLYRHGGDFEHECDSRFTLKMENQTVFLHLTGLTPVDSGNYTCECSRGGETQTIHLNITVEGEEERESGVTSHTRLLNALIGATTVICITANIFSRSLKTTQMTRIRASSNQPLTFTRRSPTQEALKTRK
uniref:Ig-like domain-containing protein n=1 Tax=Gasterosteus aculeatus aculeatus TaxID=481459 RepID=A0AAQ4QWA1_GASAC